MLLLNLLFYLYNKFMIEDEKVMNRYFLVQNNLLRTLKKFVLACSRTLGQRPVKVFHPDRIRFCESLSPFSRLSAKPRARIYKEEFYSREFYSGHFNTLSRERGEGPHMRSERCTLHNRTLQL